MQRVRVKEPPRVFFLSPKRNAREVNLIGQKKLHGIKEEVHPNWAKWPPLIWNIIETEITGAQACARGGRSLKVGPTRDPEVSPRINYRLATWTEIFVENICNLVYRRKRYKRIGRNIRGTRSLITPILFLIIIKEKRRKRKRKGEKRVGTRRIEMETQ